ncbi:hypothetical protein DFH06DRAFT_1123722 [Mycena polygramma]|nr:hypothetical protein DFH06DRAFT_1123722 [Mycena polygramma]
MPCALDPLEWSRFEASLPAGACAESWALALSTFSTIDLLREGLLNPGHFAKVCNFVSTQNGATMRMAEGGVAYRFASRCYLTSLPAELVIEIITALPPRLETISAHIWPSSISATRLISGSVVTNIIHPCTGGEPRGLDVFCPNGHGFLTYHYLQLRSGYQHISDLRVAPRSRVAHAWALRADEEGARPIRVFESHSSTPLDSIVLSPLTTQFAAWSLEHVWHGYAETTLAGVSMSSALRLPLDSAEHKDRFDRTLRRTISQQHTDVGGQFLAQYLSELSKTKDASSCGFAHCLRWREGTRSIGSLVLALVGCWEGPVVRHARDRFLWQGKTFIGVRWLQLSESSLIPRSAERRYGLHSIIIKPGYLSANICPSLTQCHKRTAGVNPQVSVTMHGAWLLPHGERTSQCRIRVPATVGVTKAYSVADLDTHAWFDSAAINPPAHVDLSLNVIRVERFPLGAPSTLDHAYSVLVVSQQSAELHGVPINYLISGSLPHMQRRWRGNVMVFKHGKRAGNPIINVTREDTVLVKAIVKRYHDLDPLRDKRRIAYRSTSRSARRNACDLFERRVHRYIQPFFRTRRSLASFWATLDRLQSWIVGSVSLAVLSMGAELPCPSNLNLICGRGHQQEWAAVLISEFGFTQVQRSACTAVFDDVAATFIRFVHAEATMFTKDKTITLTAARDRDCFELLFAAPNTDMWNAISGTCLVAPNVHMTSRFESLQGWRQGGWRERKVITPVSASLPKTTAWPGVVELHEATREWTRPCGTACPARWRFSAGLSGVGRWKWRDEGEVAVARDDLLDRFDQSSIKWRTGERCYNRHCWYSNLQPYRGPKPWGRELCT